MNALLCTRFETSMRPSSHPQKNKKNIPWAKPVMPDLCGWIACIKMGCLLGWHFALWPRLAGCAGSHFYRKGSLQQSSMCAETDFKRCTVQKVFLYSRLQLQVLFFQRLSGGATHREDHHALLIDGVINSELSPSLSK